MSIKTTTDMDDASEIKAPCLMQDGDLIVLITDMGYDYESTGVVLRAGLGWSVGQTGNNFSVPQMNLFKGSITLENP